MGDSYCSGMAVCLAHVFFGGGGSSPLSKSQDANA